MQSYAQYILIHPVTALFLVIFFDGGYAVTRLGLVLGRAAVHIQVTLDIVAVHECD